MKNNGIIFGYRTSEDITVDISYIKTLRNYNDDPLRSTL